MEPSPSGAALAAAHRWHNFELNQVMIAVKENAEQAVQTVHVSKVDELSALGELELTQIR